MASKQSSTYAVSSTLYTLRATFVSKDGNRQTTRVVADDLSLTDGIEKKDGLMQIGHCVAAYLEPKN